MAWGHNNLSIICVNQKWKGLTPSFKRRAGVTINENNFGENNKIDLEKIIKEEPKAWIKKYFRAASEEYREFLDIIKGINDKRFNSRPVHTLNHEREEKARSVPNNNIEKKKVLREDK